MRYMRLLARLWVIAGLAGCNLPGRGAPTPTPEIAPDKTATAPVELPGSSSETPPFLFPTGPLTIAALGDSLTAGDGDYSEKGGYPGRLQTLLQDMRPGTLITNFGKSGWTSTDLIYGTNGEASQLDQVITFKPQVALVWIGSNDLWYLYEYGGGADEESQNLATYSANLDTILGRLTDSGARVFIALLDDQSKWPAARGDAFTSITEDELVLMSKQVDAYNEAITQKAEQYGAVTVDFFNTTLFTDLATLADDGMHPNEAGYDQVAQIWFEALTAYLGASVGETAPPEAATAIPTPTAPPAPLVPGASSIAGCPLFPVDNVWNVRVDTLPVDPNSDAYVAAMGPDTELHPDFGAGLWEGRMIGIPYTLVGGDQPRVPISFEYADESDPGPYPIPPDATIEGAPDPSGDRHILLVDRDNCILYEIYHAYPQSDGSWQAGSGAVWDLRSNALRPDTWTSADAAGLPMLPGLVRYDEVAAGVIPHAIRFTSASIRANYIWPARHYSDCGGYGEGDMSVPPYGQRFRLKASFDISPFPPEVQVILTALKNYGMILADCGADWFIGGAPDDRWNNDELVTALRGVHGSDFEAVDESGLMVDPDSGQTR